MTLYSIDKFFSITVELFSKFTPAMEGNRLKPSAKANANRMKDITSFFTILTSPLATEIQSEGEQ
jgi:hypothetical protein